MDDITYWKNLASMAYRRLIEQNNGIAAAVIKNGTMDVWFDNHENWNGGIDYWTIVFILKYMVDHATHLLAVYDGQPGGTASTIRYARKKGLEITIIEP